MPEKTGCIKSSALDAVQQRVAHRSGLLKQLADVVRLGDT